MVIFKRGGTARFWGDWFGRPYDNIHIVSSADFCSDKTVLTITFAHSERCIIYHPEGIVNESKRFYVHKAEKIIWQWYHYGREQTPENLYQIEYAYAGEHAVCAQYSGICENGRREFDPKNFHAFELC